MATDFPTHWRIRKFLGWRYGMRCRVDCRGPGPGPLNELVVFEDGLRVVAPRYFARLGVATGEVAEEALEEWEWREERAAIREYLGGQRWDVAEVGAWLDWMGSFHHEGTKGTKGGRA